MRTNIAIVRDHSGSMSHLRSAALNDYNNLLQALKTEKVQPNKDLIIRDTNNGSMFGGNNARNLLGLPTVGEIRLAPGNMGNYEVYVRSTSNNRKLYANSNVLVRA